MAKKTKGTEADKENFTRYLRNNLEAFPNIPKEEKKAIFDRLIKQLKT